MGTISQDPISFAAGDANLYRYVGNGVTNSTDPTGLAEGHHWVPIAVAWNLFKEGVISKDELFYFAGRRSGGLLHGHTWWTQYNGVCHEDYSAAVKEELIRWKNSSRSADFSTKQVADNIRDGKSWDGRRNGAGGLLLRFNGGVKADAKPLLPGALNRMDGEGNTDEEIRSKGATSLRTRGKIAIFMAAMGSLGGTLEAAGIATGTVESLTGREMDRARSAAEKGDFATTWICLTGRGFKEQSVYEVLESSEAGHVIAIGFFDIVDPRMQELVKEMRTIEHELQSL